MCQKNLSVIAFFLAMPLAAMVSGMSVYFWQQSIQEKTVEDKKVSITSDVENESMAEYVDTAWNTGLIPPRDLVRVEFKGIPINVKTTGASAPVYVYAQPDWEKREVQDVQLFYLKFINPMFSLEDPKVAKQEFWSGPLYGKLKLLIQ